VARAAGYYIFVSIFSMTAPAAVMQLRIEAHHIDTGHSVHCTGPTQFLADVGAYVGLTVSVFGRINVFMIGKYG